MAPMRESIRSLLLVVDVGAVHCLAGGIGSLNRNGHGLAVGRTLRIGCVDYITSLAETHVPFVGAGHSCADAVVGGFDDLPRSTSRGPSEGHIDGLAVPCGRLDHH